MISIYSFLNLNQGHLRRSVLPFAVRRQVAKIEKRGKTRGVFLFEPRNLAKTERLDFQVLFHWRVFSFATGLS